MLKAVVFDLDDTLYPEREFVLSGFRAVARWAEQNIGITFAVAYHELVQLLENRMHSHTFDRFLENHNMWSISAVREMVRVYRTHPPEITSFANVPKMLIQLKKRFKLGLLSDGHLEVQQRKLEALCLGHYFDAIVFSDQWGKDAWKPSARSFRAMLELLSTKATQAVYVADNPTKDFLGARRTGMPSIRVHLKGGVYNTMEPETSDHAPNIEVPNLSQLEEATLIIDRDGAL